MQYELKPVSRNLIETVMVILLFVTLLYALYSVLQIFFGVLTFALVFAVSFSAPYAWMVRRFNGRRKLAGIIYSVLLTAIIALPLVFLISAMSRHLKELTLWLAQVKTHGLPPLPQSITNLPVIGSDIATFWNDFRESPKDVIHLHEREVNIVIRHIISSGIDVLGVAIQLILGIIISAFFLERGESMIDPIRKTLKHLVAHDAGELLSAITQAVKGVSIGVMGTSFIASFVAWTGLMMAGIPFATGIAGIIFFLTVIQVGPMILWIPLTIWEGMLGHQHETVILVIYMCVILVIDFVIKPILIGKSGGKLPFLVLFIGVVGGLATWGFTGMFKGAIITSVFYTIYTSWLERKRVGEGEVE